MIAGYLRLSRDEDRKQYVSIENQRLILNQYAAREGIAIDRFYEDDNVSGYTFNRPGMEQMLHDIDAGIIHTVLAKDLSRIGRHNAKVLLLIEDFKERGIRFILVNDNYDSLLTEEDDILGIKTWYNERYVKDASRKMRRVLRARQSEGTLPVRPCFGYETVPEDKLKVRIVESEARVIRRLFDLYLEGEGYRRIADRMNRERVDTPSRFMSLRGVRGKGSAIAVQWSADMVRDILKNDFYVGTLRTHVRARKAINGTDQRVPVREQHVFEHHHEAIVAGQIYEAAQRAMAGRIRNDYRGERQHHSIFSQCIYCRDCGARMSLVRRTKRARQTYFICRTYNAKGKQYCTSHTVEEEDLLEAVLFYLREKLPLLELAPGLLKESRAQLRQQEERYKKELQAQLFQQERKLQVILERNITERLEESVYSDIIAGASRRLEEETAKQIHRLREAIREQEREQEPPPGRAEEMEEGAEGKELLERVIDNKTVTALDIELLIEAILVEADGSFEIRLR